MEKATSIYGDSHAFIVRIWNEPREIVGAATKWRGRVEHLSSQRARYFEDLATLAEFITEFVGIGDGSRLDRTYDKPPKTSW